MHQGCLDTLAFAEIHYSELLSAGYPDAAARCRRWCLESGIRELNFAAFDACDLRQKRRGCGS